MLTVRPITNSDIPLLTDYWMNADEAFLRGMGADIKKIPPREHWEAMLREQVQTPLQLKRSYCIIWLIDDKPVGHSNASDIIFGKEAHMHLHIWQQSIRQKGMGTAFVKITLPYYFNDLQIGELYCEPYALNDAPNKTL
jgi:RimJ/RimL family protein N-acetyltransferase